MARARRIRAVSVGGCQRLWAAAGTVAARAMPAPMAVIRIRFMPVVQVEVSAPIIATRRPPGNGIHDHADRLPSGRSIEFLAVRSRKHTYTGSRSKISAAIFRRIDTASAEAESNAGDPQRTDQNPSGSHGAAVRG